MVSIPDWTKFQRLHETARDSTNIASLDKYYKQREEETIRQAENQGLLRTATSEFLLEVCGPANRQLNGRRAKDVSHLYIVQLCGVHLRKIGDLSYCVNLRVCILSNNFLTKIDGLAGCRHMYKLDLHSNQLSSLPGIAFWSTLRNLRFLHLHDNPLGKYENLQNLATCPNLIALTMYDTPISLKRNYRHHVVNSIWSLKALDHFVVSDEEIIEDAVFGGRFSAKHPAFRITIFYNTPESYTYADEMQLMKEIGVKMNTVLAHHSPVLIVQKFIRGHLTRKRYGKLKPPVKAVDVTGVQVVPSDVVPPPPSSSPVPDGTTQEPAVSEMGTSDQNDADNMGKVQRESSAAYSEAASYQRLPEGYQGPFPTPMDMANMQYDPESPVLTADGSPRKRKNLCINLAKLQSGTFSSLYDEQIATETMMPQESTDRLDTSSRKKTRKKKEKMPQKKVVKSVKQFFGPVMDSVHRPETEEVMEEDEDSPVTQYRLRGIQPKIAIIDPMTEMILQKQEAGRLVRDAEYEHHRNLQSLPTPRAKSQKKMNNDQRIFSRVHGTMGMSCLFAVHQAYKDREKAERTAQKMEHILSMRDDRDRAKERIKIYHDEKRSTALKQRDMERAKTIEFLERREMTRLSYLDKRHEIKSKSTDLTKTFKQDYTFITEFSNQHTSVSNALMRHDRQAKTEDRLQVKSDLVQNLSSAETEQKEVVKKYLEHRQLMRQTESAMARATLDTRMLQEANERMLEAKSRVAHQKAKRDTAQSFYPLPVMTPVPTATSAPPIIAHGLTRWETSALISQGRLGKHPTLVL